MHSDRVRFDWKGKYLALSQDTQTSLPRASCYEGQASLQDTLFMINESVALCLVQNKGIKNTDRILWTTCEVLLMFLPV